MKTLDPKLYAYGNKPEITRRAKTTPTENTVLRYLRRNSGSWVTPYEIAYSTDINIVTIRNVLFALFRMRLVVHNGDDSAFRKYKIFSDVKTTIPTFDPPKFPWRRQYAVD